MITYPSIETVALAALCVAAAGCGANSEPRLTKAEFLVQGNAICAKGTGTVHQAGLTFFKTPGHPTAQETTAFAKKVALQWRVHARTRRH